MSQASPSLRAFIERLIAYEARGKKASRPDAAGVPPVLDKLRPLLTTLMGSGGFRALLSRALALTNRDLMWTRAMHVKENGTLEGWDELSSNVDPVEFREGGILLLANLLHLMVTFIGPTLTAGLVGQLWPEILPHDLNFTNGKT